MTQLSGLTGTSTFGLLPFLKFRKSIKTLQADPSVTAALEDIDGMWLLKSRNIFISIFLLHHFLCKLSIHLLHLSIIS